MLTCCEPQRQGFVKLKKKNNLVFCTTKETDIHPYFTTAQRTTSLHKHGKPVFHPMQQRQPPHQLELSKAKLGLNATAKH